MLLRRLKPIKYYITLLITALLLITISPTAAAPYAAHTTAPYKPGKEFIPPPSFYIELPEPKPTPTLAYIGTYHVTGYDPYCAHCCGKADGVTASGAKATPGKTIAMAGYEFGTQIYIEGLGTFTVEDRGVGQGVIDVACEDHEACYKVTGSYAIYLVN